MNAKRSPTGYDGQPVLVCVLNRRIHGSGASKAKQRFTVSKSALIGPNGWRVGDDLRMDGKVWSIEAIEHP